MTTSSTTTKAAPAVLSRLMLQERVQRVSVQERVQTCGRIANTSGSGVGPSLIVKADGKHSFGGFLSCGSVWSCPNCSGKLRGERIDEVNEAVAKWRHQELDVLMLTLTLSHHRGDKLTDLLKALNDSWGSVLSGRSKGIMVGLGVRHSIRALEVKHGLNGWHPHLHIALFMDTRTSQSDRDALKAHVLKVYGGRLRKHDHWASASIGVDLRLLVSAEYIGKLQDGIDAAKGGYELASLDTKRSRGDSLLPFELALLASGDPRMKALFREYELSMKGQRALFWSQGFKRALSTMPAPPVEEQLTIDDALDLVVDTLPINYEWLPLFKLDGFRAHLLSGKYHELSTHTDRLHMLEHLVSTFKL